MKKKHFLTFLWIPGTCQVFFSTSSFLFNHKHEIKVSLPVSSGVFLTEVQAEDQSER